MIAISASTQSSWPDEVSCLLGRYTEEGIPWDFSLWANSPPPPPPPPQPEY